MVLCRTATRNRPADSTTTTRCDASTDVRRPALDAWFRLAARGTIRRLVSSHRPHKSMRGDLARYSVDYTVGCSPRSSSRYPPERTGADHESLDQGHRAHCRCRRDRRLRFRECAGLNEHDGAAVGASGATRHHRGRRRRWWPPHVRRVPGHGIADGGPHRWQRKGAEWQQVLAPRGPGP